MDRRSAYLVLVCVIAACAAGAFGFGTTTVPATRLQTRYSGLTSPIFVTHAGDGSKRIFIVERGGIIKVVQPGSNMPTPFLNISGLISTDGERGLLGLAFHPQYETNRRFFVYFTRVGTGSLEISEFEASPSDPNSALTAEKPLLSITHSANNHNGGTIAFGPDGYLYAAPGDGGGGNDPPNNAQNINSLLGKVLRIDVNVPSGATAPYVIPPTNPYVGATPGADEIFAIGLRNPFRWSFDRGGTNQLWLADVGQNNWEEVDIIVNGGNYGWRIFEGNACTGLGPDPCTASNYVAPVFVYSSQPSTQRCSITGGYVYRGTQRALPNGAYIYGDYCTGEILQWHNGQQSPLHDIDNFNLVSFGEDEDGELYVVQAGAGVIQKIVPAKASADFDGDFRTDLSVFRSTEGNWYIRNSGSNTIRIRQFGVNGDLPTAEDYDGDRKADISVYRQSEGRWYYIRSSNSTFAIVDFGETGDMPAAGDYDGDALADFVLFRPSTGQWHMLRSSDGGFRTYQWGVNGDVPVPGDYDGDGRYDVAVWRPSTGTWYTIYSTTNALRITQYGQAGDVPATGDFDGDGRNDLSVFRPLAGSWFQKRSSNNSFVTVSWGVNGDIPVVGDYDSDNRDDIAVFRPSAGVWFIVKSSGGLIRTNGWGVLGDFPVPNIDNP